MTGQLHVRELAIAMRGRRVVCQVWSERKHTFFMGAKRLGFS